MKKFLFLSLFMVACNSAPQKSNAPSTDVDRATQLGCLADFTSCVNTCHHIGGTNAEEFGCVATCRETQKKCGR